MAIIHCFAHACKLCTVSVYVESGSSLELCIKTKPWFAAYGCFMEDIELGSHFSMKAMQTGSTAFAVPNSISLYKRPLTMWPASGE